MTNKETVTKSMINHNRNTITYHRNPTDNEIKFGQGATHYKEFTLNECWNELKDDFKKWFVCPIDKLTYYYC